MSSGSAFRGCGHHRSAADHYRRRLVRRRSNRDLPGLDGVASRDALFAAALDLRRTGGPAPGPDGVTWADLGPGDLGRLCGVLADAVRSGAYRPGPVRSVRVPKPGGGSRTLSVGNLADRIVAKALGAALIHAPFDGVASSNWG